MDYLLKSIALHCNLSQAHYWHLRLLSSILFLPFLTVLYLLLFDRRKRPSAPPARPNVSLWINSEGQLIARPAPAGCPRA